MQTGLLLRLNQAVCPESQPTAGFFAPGRLDITCEKGCVCVQYFGSLKLYNIRTYTCLIT